MKSSLTDLNLTEKMLISAFALTVIAILLYWAGVPGGVDSAYSEGSRVGVITKVSREGLFWKSWEGEMLVGGAQGITGDAAARVFKFNVVPEIVDTATAAMREGDLVEVEYRQWWLKPITIANRDVVVGVRRR